MLRNPSLHKGLVHGLHCLVHLQRGYYLLTNAAIWGSQAAMSESAPGPGSIAYLTSTRMLLRKQFCGVNHKSDHWKTTLAVRCRCEFSSSFLTVGILCHILLCDLRFSHLKNEWCLFTDFGVGGWGLKEISLESLGFEAGCKQIVLVPPGT